MENRRHRWYQSVLFTPVAQLLQHYLRGINKLPAMAHIDVQRKKKSPLPWILVGLLLLAAIAYFLWTRNQTHDNGNLNEPVTDSINTTTPTTDTLIR